MTAPDLATAAPGGARERPSTRLIVLLATTVLAVAVAGYALTGWPQLVRGEVPTAAAASAEAASAARSASVEQIASMVGGLAARLKERPDDAEGWFMLARAYTVLGRFDESLPAYARAAELNPGNAGLVADWADATAAARSSITHPDAVALIERALAIDPTHPKALALAGTMELQRGHAAEAASLWQRLADRLPPGSELRQQVEAGIADARARTVGTGAPGATASSAASSAPVGATAGATAGAATGSVRGRVTLAPELAASVAPGDTLFVFARRADGPRMPLAVRRVTAAELKGGHYDYALDDSMAMTPAARLSTAERVVIGARISRSGNATPVPGDLQGESAPVAPGAAGVAVRIDRIVR